MKKKYFLKDYTPLQLFAVFLKTFYDDSDIYCGFRKFVNDNRLSCIKKAYYEKFKDDGMHLFTNVSCFEDFLRNNYIKVPKTFYRDWYTNFLVGCTDILTHSRTDVGRKSCI